MALPDDTAVSRLLREMRERDQLFKSLGANRTMETIRDSRKHTDHITKMMDPLQDVFKQVQDSSSQRAMEVVKQLANPNPARPARATPRPQPKPVDTPVRTVADLGEMIRKARKTMKLNQTEFAAHAGVGRRFISELEGGKSSLEFDKVMACMIAAGIDISARSRKP